MQIHSFTLITAVNYYWSHGFYYIIRSAVRGIISSFPSIPRDTPFTSTPSYATRNELLQTALTIVLPVLICINHGLKRVVYQSEPVYNSQDVDR